MKQAHRVVIVGHGMVGHRVLELLAEHTEYALTVLAEEPQAAYDRVHLSALFSGSSASELSLVPPHFMASWGIELHLNERAVAIDRLARTVTTASGLVVPYDVLVLATGSYPFVPAIPGADREDCFVYRTIEDVKKLQAACREVQVGAVVGGGLLGLEAAKALVDMGLVTHVVEFAPRLMAVQLDELGGRLLRRRIEALGVQVHTQKNTLAIVDGEQRRCCMQFADGSALETDLVVFSAGIRPRDELARSAGLAVGERGGIVIDGACRTSDPHIYAVGECALWQGRIFGLVAPGYEMAKVAAEHIAGTGQAVFAGADMSTKLKLMGVDVASIGDAHGSTPGCVSVLFCDEAQGLYRKIVVAEDGKVLLGAVLVGDTEPYGSWLQMVRQGVALPEQPETMLVPALAPVEGLALGDEAQVCSCNNVSKGALKAAIGAGCTTLAALKAATKAATSCGGCAPLVSRILNEELAARGAVVNNHLCEHFPLSRQELYHLVRIERLATFWQVLERHGVGMGCDVCKPAIASILASCWNDFILQREHAPLQDSNDYYLANIQRDGSYSVVPRIPGGEITPEKLIAIGTIAKRYNLYTKITGGQRIDLLGAAVHQLPHIWKELIEAGFESGHAYGKALRTVKSCVGTTWCRYGVQDSVSLAIELEHRYKGLRSPHKLKFGVSGCTRECAEAQGKDVGVIATERGWNLYVCGNGGMKPRHAELLAADLDKATLIRYIDRFLMFYIRTAERLQRTSVWRDNLEGGLDYLKQVIVHDALGLAAELEAQLAHVVATYQDEWRTAIEQPETLRRFRTFVNSPAADGSLAYVQERGQRIPAPRKERLVEESAVAAED
jgi:nitrite reductase (NADH) large subunit